jgi:hypothetical protein
MKKIVMRLCWLLWWAGIFGVVSGRTIYVDQKNPNSASGNGSILYPYCYINSAISDVIAGDTIKVYSGTYREKLSITKSGTANAPIVICGQGNATVISGLRPLSVQPSATSPGKYDAYMGVAEPTNQLFYNGVPLPYAQYPNHEDYYRYKQTYLYGKLIADQPDRIRLQSNSYFDLSGSRAWILSGGHFVFQCAEVNSNCNNDVFLSKSNGFRVEDYSDYKDNDGNCVFQSRDINTKVYFTGKECFIDTYGEWYQRSDLSIVLNPPAVSGGSFEYRPRANDLEIRGASYLVLQDISLYATSVKLNNSNNVTVKNVNVTYGNVIDNIIDGHCRNYLPSGGSGVDAIKSLLGTGLFIDIYSHHVKILGCKVSQCDGDGITVSGNYNTIESCTVENCNLKGVDCGVVFFGGKLNRLCRSNLTGSGRMTVYIRMAENGTVEQNTISDAAKLTNDCGVLYSYNTQDTNSINIIDGNYVSNNNDRISGAGIYMDNCATHFLIQHNLVFDCHEALRMNGPNMPSCIGNYNKLFHNTFVGKESAAFGFPKYGKLWGSEAYNNLFVGELDDATLVGWIQYPNTEHNRIYNSINDVKFRDYPNNDYHLSEISPAIDRADNHPSIDIYYGCEDESGDHFADYGCFQFWNICDHPPIVNKNTKILHLFR